MQAQGCIIFEFFKKSQEPKGKALKKKDFLYFRKSVPVCAQGRGGAEGKGESQANSPYLGLDFMTQA